MKSDTWPPVLYLLHPSAKRFKLRNGVCRWTKLLLSTTPSHKATKLASLSLHSSGNASMASDSDRSEDNDIKTDNGSDSSSSFKKDALWSQILSRLSKYYDDSDFLYCPDSLSKTQLVQLEKSKWHNCKSKNCSQSNLANYCYTTRMHKAFYSHCLVMFIYITLKEDVSKLV